MGAVGVGDDQGGAGAGGVGGGGQAGEGEAPVAADDDDLGPVGVGIEPEAPRMGLECRARQQHDAGTRALAGHEVERHGAGQDDPLRGKRQAKGGKLGRELARRVLGVVGHDHAAIREGSDQLPGAGQQAPARHERAIKVD